MNFPAKQVTRRYAFVASFLVLICFFIVGKAAYIMTVKKNFWTSVSERYTKDNEVVPPTRGNILADNGEMLAASLPEYKLYMDFMSWEKDSTRQAKDQHRRDSILTNTLDSICQGMHEIFPDIDPEAFGKLMMEGRAKKSHHWLLYNKRVSYIQYKRVKTLPLFRLPDNSGGFHTDEFKTRKNPYGRLATRTIGDLYVGKDSARTGLELSCDSILRGKPGFGHRQKVRKRYLTIIDKPAEDGCDILTTLNVGMQDICEKALGDKLAEIEANSGVCILMEVATGDIKAMTSLSRMKDGTYQEVNADAVKNLYEPGSVFKPMSFLVAMDDGYISMNDAVDVGGGIREMYGAKMRDANWRSGGSGLLTVPQILQKSSNVGVSTLIDRHYHDNPKKFVEGIYRIGVAEDLKIPIPGYARPRIRMPKDDGSNWSKTALPWMSIGYETQIPPITTINFYNGIANNGKLLRPRLIKAIMRQGEVVKEFPVEVLREQMAKPEAVKNIQDCLESVVSVGLGKKAGSRMFRVSGKTGTAQVWTKNGFAAQYLVSFAGYFPSDKPLYSCIVCIQKGAPASGGGMCAPVFKRVAETVMAQQRRNDYSVAKDTLHSLAPTVKAGNIEAATRVLGQLSLGFTPADHLSDNGLTWGSSTVRDGVPVLSCSSDIPDLTVPDVTGYGLRDALFRLEKMGMKVKVKGVGHVSHQSLKPGDNFKPGQTIVLALGDKTDLADIEEPRTGTETADTLNSKGDKAGQTGATPDRNDGQQLKQRQDAKEKGDSSAPAERRKSTTAETDRSVAAAQKEPAGKNKRNKQQEKGKATAPGEKKRKA